MSNCPRLAPPAPTIITINNADVLKLSNYDTIPGSITQITCLGYPEYIIIGPKSLKCLSSGVWNNTIPRCVAERFVSSTTTEDSNATELLDSDISMLPIICVAVLLALVFLVLVILVTCTIRFWRKPKPPPPTEASTITERNSYLRSSEPNLYSRPPTMFNNRQYADSWDSVSVDFERRGGAMPEVDGGYDYVYNGSTVTAINSNASNGRSNKHLSPKHWSNSFPKHAHPQPKHGFQNRAYQYY